MLIIGITGTIGAGKGTIVDYLVNNHKFTHYSVRQYLTEELNKRNLEINRDNLVNLANELRTNNSPSYIAEQLFEQAKKSNDNCVIESLRTPGEILELKNKGNFHLFAAQANQEKRYERVLKRKSSTDAITFEEFKNNEEREMQSEDPNKQNLLRCIEMANFTFHNNGTIEELHEKVKGVINDIK